MSQAEAHPTPGYVCEPVPSASNHSANQLTPSDRAVHDWYRFVLSFPPHLVRHYLDRFEMDDQGCVLDPFCGTGTTLVECKKQGISSVGIEAHPMSHLAASAKTNWAIDPDKLAADAERIAERVWGQLEADGVPDQPPSLYASGSDRAEAQPSAMRTLSPDHHRLLLKDSISPRPLHKVLALRDALMDGPESAERFHQQVAMAKIMVNQASNLHFGPEVGLGRIKQDSEVVYPWLEMMRRMAGDLRTVGAQKPPPSSVHHADARQIVELIEPNSIDAVITSPPYPNEKDYTRTTRLETVVLGLVENKEQLRGMKKTLVRSNTRGVYKSDDDDQWIGQFPEIEQLAQTIEQRRTEMGKTSGFERTYHRVVKLYFGGMARHLADLRRVLRPEARLAYVVGDQASYLRVMIRTGQILARIAESLGYQVESLDLFRTRAATATREPLREEVLVLRWVGQDP